MIGLAALAAMFLVACGSSNDHPDASHPQDVQDMDWISPDLPGDALIDSPDIEPPPLGEPVDLVPFLRLRASATRPLGLWPREAEDAIATVRDGSRATGWKVPLDEEAVVDLDLLPWPGRPIRVGSVSIAWEGPAPTDVTVELLDACGTEPARTLPWNDPSSPLDLGDTWAGCVQIRISARDGLSLTSLRLESREQLEFPPVAPAVQPLSDPAPHPESGVIEGFYGIPWSWVERERMFATQAMLGLGIYLYAPKDDPLHRALWRQPYPIDDMDRFRALASRARDLGIRMIFGISPFIDYADNDTDYAILRDKIQAFLDAGFSGYAILADDIEFAPGIQVDGALGALHVSITNRLLADVPSDRVMYCPTVYSDERTNDWPGGKAYLETHKDLDPSIRILWTGPRTGNRTLNADDMLAFQAATGRKPLVWDNSWANDGGDGFFGRLMLGPYSGRSDDLMDGVIGVAQNLSIQGSSSRLTLATFAQWLDDPATTPAAQIDRAVAMESSFSFGIDRDEARDEATLRFFMQAFEGDSQDDPPHFKRLENDADVLVSSLRQNTAFTGTPAGVTGLLGTFARMVASQSELYHSGLDPDLVDDLWWPAEKLVWDGRAGLLLLSALGQRLSNRDAQAILGEAQSAMESSASCRFLYSPEVIPSLKKAVESRAPVDAGFQVPAVADPAPVACSALQTLRWRPFSGDYELAIEGLPGATVKDGEILWQPPRGGRYRGVVVAKPVPGGPLGWAHHEFELACSAR
jgi:hypothetical protein